jgi:hypothetical protein
MKIIEKKFDIETGLETFTERDETADEAKARLEFEAAATAAAALKAEAEAAKASAQAKLSALGFTTDDLRALGL